MKYYPACKKIKRLSIDLFQIGLKEDRIILTSGLPYNMVGISMKWTSTQENLSSGFANNKGADQPGHPYRLISAFVSHFLESIIYKLATSEIPIF